MPLHRFPLKAITCLALFLAIFFKLFHYSFALTFFSPCCVIALYRFSTLKSVFFSFFLGFCIDLLTLTPTSGLYAISLTCASYLLTPLTRYFFSDNITTLPLMTVLFSASATAITGFIQVLSHTPFYHPVLWMQYDLAIYPLIDGAFSFITIQLPFLIQKKLLKV
jgi:hypothetical protein